MANTQPIADGTSIIGTDAPARIAVPGRTRLAAGLGVLSRVFGADIRSLAAFRIVLGIVVLIDLATRWSEIRIHYTDAGILPRKDAMAGLNTWRWSLLFMNGTEAFARLVFLAAMAAAIALMLGYRTRLASILVWILVVSIQARNPLVLSGADGYLRVLLFWAMFLPLAATWSLDRRMRRAPSPSTTWVVSVATAALFLQIAFVYLFTAILKSGDEWRTEFTAIWYALGAAQLTTPFGAWLHQFPDLLRVLTVSTLAIEVIAPVILFVPWRNTIFRMIGISLIAGLQIGIFLTMNIGIFPIVSTLCMVCFLPTAAWSWLGRTVRIPARWASAFAHIRQQVAGGVPGWRARFTGAERSMGIVADPDATSPIPITTRVTFTSEGDRTTALPLPHRTSRSARFAANLAAAFLLFVVLGWNIASVSAFTMPDAARPVVYGLGVYQRWSMFAPKPPGSTQWTVIQGTLADGQQVNLLYPLVQDDLTLLVPFTWDRPANIGSDYYGSKEWRKYFEALNEDSGKSERRVLVTWLCRTWNREHAGDEDLATVAIYSVLERTLPEGESAEQRHIERIAISCS